jgi:integrase
LPKLKSARTVKAKLNWWRHRHGERMLAELTREVVAKARDDLLATPKQRGDGPRSAADVNRTLAALSSACTYGVRELGWLERNPLETVNKPTESKGRVRYLTDAELPRLLDWFASTILAGQDNCRSPRQLRLVQDRLSPAFM